MPIVRVWIVCLTLLFPLWAKNALHLDAKEQAFLREHPVITVHNEMDYPPYNFYRDGKAQGLSIDYMNLLAKRLGIQVRYIHGPTWSGFMKMIKEGKLDVMLNIMRTPQREEFLHFTEPYAATHKTIFSQDPSINTLEDLEGKRVCVPKDFFIHHFLEAYYPEIFLTLKPSVLECLRSVARGESDATIASYSIAAELIKRERIPIEHFAVLSDKRMTVGLSIATAPQLKILRDILQKAMYTVTDKELKTLSKRWLEDSRQNPDWLYREKGRVVPYQKTRVIRMCNNANWKPIEFAKEGRMDRMEGIAIDTLRLLEKRLNVRFQNVPTRSWVESQHFLREGKCEILPAAVATKERKAYARFTHPYLSYRLVIITRDDKPLVKDLSDLAGKTVARKRGSGLISRLKQLYPSIKIIETKDYLESLQKVASGEAYATIATIPVASYYINRFNLKGLRIAGYTDMKYRLSIAVNKKETELLHRLDRALASITPREKNTIYNKWVGQKALVEPFDYRWLYLFGAIALLVLGFLLYRQALLRRHNRELDREIKKALRENMAQREMIREREKLAAMGEMIGVIAHQWRQPLNSLALSLQNLKYKYRDGLVDDDFIAHFVGKNIERINFLSQTIEDFRNFFHFGKGKENFSVRQAIEAVFSMYSLDLRKNHIQYRIEGEDFKLVGSRSEFQQVILNLISNAKDALREREGDREIQVILKGKQVIFEDNAGEPAEEVLQRLFDSYFTTKADGSGIGLYISRQIVEERLGGRIRAERGDEGLRIVLDFRGVAHG